MKNFDFELDEDVDKRPKIGLITLQQDETIEGEFRQLFNGLDLDLYVSRVKSDPDVTLDTLGQMETDLPAAASLLPGGRAYDVIGYGCTSGTSVIGAKATAKIIQTAVNARHITDPLSATIAWCKAHNIRRLALLTPYVESVNQSLRDALTKAGIKIDLAGSFNIAEEAKVVRISANSIVNAATKLCENQTPDAVFLSCTNLRTTDAIPKIRSALGLPVISSNSALCWHMKHLAGIEGEN